MRGYRAMVVKKETGGEDGRYRQIVEWTGRGRDCFLENKGHILVPRG